MMHGHSHDDARPDHMGDTMTKPWHMSPPALVGMGVAVAAAFYYLWTYHQQHVVALLPLALFLLCPLMHLFGHGHHGGHRSHDSHASSGTQTEAGRPSGPSR